MVDSIELVDGKIWSYIFMDSTSIINVSFETVIRLVFIVAPAGQQGNKVISIQIPKMNRQKLPLANASDDSDDDDDYEKEL